MDDPIESPATGSAPFVAARGVGMEFLGGIAALRDTTLSIARNEFVAIVGPSGCGKSTLLRLIAGLVQPTRGELRVNGRAPSQARGSADGLGFVFQQPALLPWRTVEGNVRLPLELEREGGGTDRVNELIKLVGLSEFAHVHPHQLSGGMKMRVSLARALVTHPGLLLLDEPFGALDEITRQRLNEELLKLWQSVGFTGVFVTHNVFEAAFLAQRILVMSPRPGHIAAEVKVPFAYPRAASLRADADFARLCGEVSRRLEEGRP